MYKRNETITAIQWDGSLGGLNKIKEESPDLEILQYRTEGNEKGYPFILAAIGHEDNEEWERHISIKPSDYVVMIKDHLDIINYRVYTEHCFNLAFIKE